MGEDKIVRRKRRRSEPSKSGGSPKEAGSNFRDEHISRSGSSLIEVGNDFQDNPEESSLSSGREQRRNKFKEQRKSNRNTVLYAIAICGALLLGGYMWYSGNSTSSDASASLSLGSGERRSAGLFTDIIPQDGVISFPVANFADGKARYYTYKGTEKEIDFFVMSSSDGLIRAAIDSCDVCYEYHKGYHQEGDEMVCNNCGLRFPSNKINEIKGGCNPAPLTRATDGDNVVINESDILKDNNGLYF